jgi:hypothetical protein
MVRVEINIQASVSKADFLTSLDPCASSACAAGLDAKRDSFPSPHGNFCKEYEYTITPRQKVFMKRPKESKAHSPTKRRDCVIKILQHFYEDYDESRTIGQ